MPPRAGLAVLLRRREAIQIEERTDETRSLATEWICSQEPQGRAVAVEKLGEKRHEPLVIHGRRHRREPHEPVQAEVVRRDLWRPALDVARLSLASVLAPHGAGSEDGIAGTYAHELEPLPRAGAQRTVAHYDMERNKA